MAIGVCTVILACNSCVIFANDIDSSVNVTYSNGDDEIYEKITTYNASKGNLSYDDFDLPLDEETDGKLVS
ncbi:hypothetical protein [Cellulosilyticum ruminicola]|uniref:hypothetical protein n=1 Tax=Cellulosilyticum ruminicola TaxID=425254 RepID=UPI0006D0E918|nr:hypothetical protein [Cellulosilyticum ruminicola]